MRRMHKNIIIKGLHIREVFAIGVYMETFTKLCSGMVDKPKLEQYGASIAYNRIPAEVSTYFNRIALCRKHFKNGYQNCKDIEVYTKMADASMSSLNQYTFDIIVKYSAGMSKQSLAFMKQFMRFVRDFGGIVCIINEIDKEPSILRKKKKVDLFTGSVTDSFLENNVRLFQDCLNFCYLYSDDKNRLGRTFVYYGLIVGSPFLYAFMDDITYQDMSWFNHSNARKVANISNQREIKEMYR